MPTMQKPMPVSLSNTRSMSPKDTNRSVFGLRFAASEASEAANETRQILHLTVCYGNRFISQIALRLECSPRSLNQLIVGFIRAAQMKHARGKESIPPCRRNMIVVFQHCRAELV